MDKSPSTLSRLFDKIAPAYDRTNALLSLNMHKRWNRQLAKAIGQHLPSLHNHLLDLCAGTGAIAKELLQFSHDQITLLDVSPGMLALAKEQLQDDRLTFVEADALHMPFKEHTFDGVTVAYGIRNLPDLQKGFQEVRRVLKPGGIFAILELTRPTGWFRPFHSLYLNTCIPFLGKLASGEKGAYDYLARSIDTFLPVEDIVQTLQNNGFHPFKITPLSFGCATLFLSSAAS